MLVVPKPLALVLMALWLWLMPIRPALACVMLLPLMDLTLALICARKAGRPIQSAGLKRTVAKILMYELATVLAFVTETYLLSEFIPAIKLVTGMVGMTELKSCLEHLDELGGQPLFASLLGQLAPQQPLEPPNEEESPQVPPEPPKAA